MQTKSFVNVFGIKNATLKNMKIFKIITCFYLTTITILAHNEICFAKLDDMQQRIHVQLCRQSTIDRTNGEHTKNYFSAALLVRFTDTTQTIYLNNSDKTPYFASEQGDNSKYNQLHKSLNQGFDEGLLDEFINRTSRGDFVKYRLADSEMHFLAKISFKNEENTNELLEKIKTETEGKTDKIKEIEVHGFSTRDMCPCCYQHIKNYFLNLNSNLFLQDLNLQNQNISVKVFISSLVRFPQTIQDSFGKSKDSNEYKYSKYSYCPNPIIFIKNEIENGKLHCIFLRSSTKKTIINVEDANQLNETCLKKCDQNFQKIYKQQSNQN